MKNKFPRGTEDAEKRDEPEEIVTKLLQADVLVAQGKRQVKEIRAIGVTNVTYSHWNLEYGGPKSDPANG